jgi:hypothetical protein
MLHRYEYVLLMTMLLFQAFVGCFVPSSTSKCRSRSRSIRSRPSSSSSSKLYYDQNPEDRLCLDITSLERNQGELMDWLSSLTKLERSEPDWVLQDILTLSSSGLVQEHLQSVLPDAPSLFPATWSRAKFDFEWSCCLLKTVPSIDLPEVLFTGQSNTHPLRLQLVAVPPNTELPLHAHASIELDIPLLGDLYERRSNVLLSPDLLCRRPEHCIGTPLSDFSEKPTRGELNIIAQDLSERVQFPDHGSEGVFNRHKVSRGDCLVNQVGSVHQSFTLESPCLLWVLGANVHAHFRPGNFQQRQGIEELRGIEDLLND